jgi:hypothetical protein
MQFGPPQIRTPPRDRVCRAYTHFDATSAVLSVNFGLESEDKLPSLVQRIEEAVGIGAPYARMILGEVDIAFTQPNRLTSIEVRTARAEWRPEDFRRIPTASPVWFEPLIKLDENGLCVIEIEHIVAWDHMARVLALRFASISEPNWFQLGEGVLMSLDPQRRLCEFRFYDVRFRPS